MLIIVLAPSYFWHYFIFIYFFTLFNFCHLPLPFHKTVMAPRWVFFVCFDRRKDTRNHLEFFISPVTSIVISLKCSN